MKPTLFALLFFILHTMSKAQNDDPWTTYMTPVAVHQLMTGYSGSFTMVITMPMGKGKEPMVIPIQSENRMLLGGRFLELNQSGKMMGMDYAAVTTLGYNTIDKKFALTTITNMGTGTLSLFGDWDEKTKSATLFGQLTNPVTKNVIRVKQVVTFVDEDTLLIESYDQEGEGEEKLTVVYKLVRK